MKKIFVVPIICALSLGISTQVKADIIPANVQPGTINSFQTEQLRIQSAQSKLNKRKNDSNEDSNIKPLVEKQAPQQAVVKKLEFVLKGVAFDGNKTFSTEKLNSFAQPLIGKTVNYEEITKLAANITEAYKAEGYITSLAYIAPQNIQNGILKITVLEGKVGDIKVKGNKWTKESYYKDIVFNQNDIKQGEIFNINNLKESMVDINGNSYLKGKVYIDKGSAQGTTDLNLDIKDRVPLGFNVGWDNQGRDLIGVQRAVIGVTDYNVTGFGDTLGANVTLADGTTGVGTNYLAPINKHGTRLQLGYSYSDVELGGIYKPAKIEGSSSFYQIGVLHPIFKNDRFNITTDMGFDFRASDTTALNNISLNKYQTRVLRNGLNLEENDSTGRWISRLQTNFGVPILGGQSSNSHSLADSSFFKFNANLIRVQYLPKNFTGIARGSAQFASQALYGSENLQLGGQYTVRGFENGVLLGDDGFCFSLEARHPVPYLKDFNLPYWKDKTVRVPLKNRVHYAAFYDFGFAKLIHQGLNTNYTNYIQALGVGLRINVTKALTANLDFGFPLGKDRYDGQDALKFHFSLSTNLY